MILSILIYEPTFFLFVPILGIITFCNTHGTSRYKLFYTLGLFAAPIITLGFVCLWKGDVNQAQIIWHSWQSLFEAYPEEGYNPEFIGYSVQFLGWGLKGAISYHLRMLFGRNLIRTFLMLISYPMIYFLVTRVPTVSIKEGAIYKNTHSLLLSSIFIIQILGMLPMLTVLSCDLGRTIPCCMYTTFFLTSYIDYNRMNILFPSIIHNLSFKIQRYIDKKKILSSFTLYLGVFLFAPLSFCFAPTLNDNIAYKVIYKFFQSLFA